MPKRTDPIAFDPDRPLAGPPDPWRGADQPLERDGPPWFMTEMIAAEPAVAERIMDRLAADGSAGRLAGEIGEAAVASAPIVVTGCGTSEHGALGVVEILRDAMRTAGLPTSTLRPAQAFEAALQPQSGGLCIGISHDGATWATSQALAAAREAGARTALVTVSRGAPGANGIDVVLETAERDTSYCHTVGYLSPLVAAAAVASELTGTALSGGAVRTAVAGAIAAAGGALIDEGSNGPADRIADVLANARTILVVGSGADRPAARELVLKIEEGAWIPAAMRDLETFLHGHLPSTDSDTGLVLILADRAERESRVERAATALKAASVLGLRAAAILSEDTSGQVPLELTPAGRIVLAEAPDLPAPSAALLSTAPALQLVAERLARARGTNPDPIRRDDERYRQAAALAEA